MMNREAFMRELAQTGFVGETSHPVFGEGPKNAAVMLIGEAPGREETEQGRPFIGKAGKQLNEFLSAIELGREELYVTNAVKFRPYKLHPTRGSKSNRPPTRKELAFCRPFLLDEIETVSPALIVTLGNSPLLALTGEAAVGALHGRLTDWQGRRLFALYHPASVIYNRALVEVYERDMQELKATLQEHVSH